MDLIRKFEDRYNALPVQVRASFWFFVAMFLQRGISAITTPIFTRILSTSDYGVYGVYNSWLGILSVIITLHLHLGVYTQGLVKYSEDRERFSSSLQSLNLVLCAVWLVIYLLLRPFWNGLFDLTTSQMVALFITIWADEAFGMWAGSQRVRYLYRALAAVTLTASVAKPVFSIVLIRLFPEHAATARIWAIAIVEILCYGWTFFVQISRGKALFSASIWKYALSFNIPLIPHFLSQTVLNSSDRIMVKNLIGSSEAGIYDLANSVASIMMLFNSAINQTLSPWIYQKIKEDRTEDIPRITYPAMILIAIVNTILIAFAPEIIFIFAPPSYHSAIWVIPPLAMSVFFRFSYSIFANFEFYYEKTGFVAVATTIVAVANILLNFLLIPRYGFFAAGYTTLVCYALYIVMHYIFMNVVCRRIAHRKPPYDIRVLLGITAVFMTSGALFAISYRHTPMRIAMIAAFAVILIVMRKRLIKMIMPFLGRKF